MYGKKDSVEEESKDWNSSLQTNVLEGHPKEKMHQNIIRAERNFMYW